MSFYYQNVLFAQKKAYSLFKDAIEELAKKNPLTESFYKGYKQYRTPDNDFVLVWDWENHLQVAKDYGVFNEVFEKIKDIEDMTDYAYKLFEIDEEDYVVIYSDDPYDAFVEVEICTNFENNLKQFIVPHTLKNAKKWLIKISYSWGDEEPDIECLTEEEAWKYAKELAINEAETFSTEHECEVSIKFDTENNRIILTYENGYDKCYYDVVKY